MSAKSSAKKSDAYPSMFFLIYMTLGCTLFIFQLYRIEHSINIDLSLLYVAIILVSIPCAYVSYITSYYILFFLGGWVFFNFKYRLIWFGCIYFFSIFYSASIISAANSYLSSGHIYFHPMLLSEKVHKVIGKGRDRYYFSLEDELGAYIVRVSPEVWGSYNANTKLEVEIREGFWFDWVHRIGDYEILLS